MSKTSSEFAERKISLLVIQADGNPEQIVGDDNV